MTPKERVTAALQHKEPDRVPVDVWGSASRLCNKLYLEIAERENWKELGPAVKVSRSGDYVDDRVADLIGSDFRHTHVGKPKYFKSYMNDKGFVMSEWGYGYKLVNGEAVVAYNPLASADAGDIEKHTWPKTDDPGRWEGIGEQVKQWHEEDQYFISTTSVVSGLMIDLGQYLRGFEQFFMDMYIDPEFAHQLIGKMTDILIELHVNFLRNLGPYPIGWVEFSSDHGMQDRPFLAPEMYRKFLKGPYRRLFDEVRKAAPGAKIWMHCCGSVRELIPDFIDMGVDVLNSLQPRAAGMDSFELKKEFGSELIFHGGLDIQGGITGTVEEAVEEAKRRIDAFAPGGGYIFAPSNHFMQDVSMDNFFAVYETARTYGKYPL
jgi:uroporphyrinogen decarboxylase